MQMNELPGGKFWYKFTRPLLHHNCLYSYSHSSCSTRCAWKWFVLRTKRGWLLCICSVKTKKRVSWGFLWRSWHPGRSPTNLSFYFPLWPPSCLFHITKICLVKIWSQLFSLKDNFHPSSWSISVGRKHIIREKIPNGVFYTNILDILHIWATIHKGHAVTSPEDSSPSPAIIFLQRHNPRTSDYLHFCMCLKVFISTTMMASGYDLLTFPADSQASKIS